MPSTDTNRSLDALQPGFKSKVLAWLNDVIAECNSDHGPLAGMEFVILETLRSYERSDALYSQGRTKPGSIVTNARGGYSRHNFGQALDGGPKRKGHEFSWDWDQDPVLMGAQRRIADLAAKHGIRWGGLFTSITDLPHFEDMDAPGLVSCRATWPIGWIHGVSHA